MALLNVGHLLARTLWQYDFRTADGEMGRVGEGSARASEGRRRVDEFQLRATITSMSEGPYLVFRSRPMGNYGGDVTDEVTSSAEIL